MVRRSRRRRVVWTAAQGQDGFSLVELIVTVLILGVLAAIALPTYLHVRTNAWDQEAEVNLRSALTSVREYVHEHGGYTDDHAVLASIQPALSWGNEDASQGGVVAQVPGSGVADAEDTAAAGGDDEEADLVCLWTRSASGTVFVLVDVASQDGRGSYYGNAGCPTSGDELGSWSTTPW